MGGLGARRLSVSTQETEMQAGHQKTQSEPGLHEKSRKKDVTACVVWKIQFIMYITEATTDTCSYSLKWKLTGQIYLCLVQSVSFQIYMLSIIVRRLGLICKLIVLYLKTKKSQFCMGWNPLEFYSHVPSPQLESYKWETFNLMAFLI